jgi:HK97 gp10 family phage protein
MGVKFQRGDRARFYARLKKAVPGVTKKLRAANEKTASDMVGMARRLAPVAAEQGGELRSSVRYEPGVKNETAFIVRAGGALTTKPVRRGFDGSYDYALGIEFGTKEMQAQPFFYPSIRANKRAHKNRTNKALRDAIKEAGLNG